MGPIPRVAGVPRLDWRSRTRFPRRAVEPTAELRQCHLPLRRLRDQVLVRVENAAIEIGDRHGAGRLRGQERDAGRERPGGVRQDAPHERLGIRDLLQPVHVRIGATLEQIPGQEPGSPQRERNGSTHQPTGFP